MYSVTVGPGATCLSAIGVVTLGVGLSPLLSSMSGQSLLGAGMVAGLRVVRSA